MNEYFPYGEKEIAYLKKKDKKLGAIIELLGHPERPVIPDLFSGIINSILSQQISTKAADTVWERFKETFSPITPEHLEEIPDECDLIIHTSDSLASSSNSFQLFEEECLLGMSPNHFLAKAQSITRDMLVNATFLILPPENTLGELTRQFFKQLKLTPPVSMQCDNQQTLAAFVEAGMGIAFFPSLTWKVPDQGTTSGFSRL